VSQTAAENNCFLRASYQIQFILVDDEPNELLTSYVTASVMEKPSHIAISAPRNQNII
jgi:hypothetical protein